MDLILASASPRRQELLRQVGLQFRVVPSSIDESISESLTPAAYVEHLASAKAAVVARQFPGAVVIGADTTVVLDGQYLNKPSNRDEAIAMIERLSGQEHQVYTGIAVLQGQRARVEHECTAVRFRALSRQEIERYVDSGEPMDKAGGYGIQGLGAALVSSISGDYFNVVGLPICRTVLILADFGVEIF